MKQKHNVTVPGLNLTFSTGSIAQLAGGAVNVNVGETNVFVTACVAQTMRPGQDFFPLTCDYRDKYAAAGRFPGGYFKREGRPSEREILISRLCDRPCRPLFPEGFLNEVQIIGQLMSADQLNDSDIPMVNGASAALAISDIPWNGPIGASRIGLIDGEFVANMEEVLETYEKAYDPDCPVVCMDEQPVQLIGETRVPIPATKEHPERVDYEYERKGTASIFMFAEPLSGFRQATARPRRTKDDWAHEVAHLLDTRYAGFERITLVCDNLNTHTKGAFYEAFPPEQARDYVRRINFVYTPKHGSWLNVAECELSCLTSQCLKDRRIGDIETLQTEIAAWSTRVNQKQRAVDWQFTIDKARVKLKRLYPKI